MSLDTDYGTLFPDLRERREIPLAAMPAGIYDRLVSRAAAKLYNIKALRRLRTLLATRLNTTAFLLNPHLLLDADFAVSAQDIFPLKRIPFEGVEEP